MIEKEKEENRKKSRVREEKRRQEEAERRAKEEEEEKLRKGKEAEEYRRRMVSATPQPGPTFHQYPQPETSGIRRSPTNQPTAQSSLMQTGLLSEPRPSLPNTSSASSSTSIAHTSVHTATSTPRAAAAIFRTSTSSSSEITQHPRPPTQGGASTSYTTVSQQPNASGSSMSQTMPPTESQPSTLVSSASSPSQQPATSARSIIQTPRISSTVLFPSNTTPIRPPQWSMSSSSSSQRVPTGSQSRQQSLATASGSNLQPSTSDRTTTTPSIPGPVSTNSSSTLGALSSSTSIIQIMSTSRSPPSSQSQQVQPATTYSTRPPPFRSATEPSSRPPFGSTSSRPSRQMQMQVEGLQVTGGGMTSPFQSPGQLNLAFRYDQQYVPGQMPSSNHPQLGDVAIENTEEEMRILTALLQTQQTSLDRLRAEHIHNTQRLTSETMAYEETRRRMVELRQQLGTGQRQTSNSDEQGESSSTSKRSDHSRGSR